jgi:hypothetical protein
MSSLRLFVFIMCGPPVFVACGAKVVVDHDGASNSRRATAIRSALATSLAWPTAAATPIVAAIARSTFRHMR